MEQYVFGTLDVQDVFSVLDQSRTQLGRRPHLVDQSTAKASTSKTRALQRKVGSGSSSKHSGNSKIFKHTKGSAKQRLHPGLLTSQDRATAHYGAVLGLKATDDGMYLLSAGSDSRLRLWDIQSGCNTLVHYEIVRLQSSKALQLAVTQDSGIVFLPCMTSVKAFDMWSGKSMMTLQGHYENINCCCYSTHDQELYTGGNDRQILVWSPLKLISDDMDECDRTGQLPAVDEDSWSD
ncbi:hypothetical protein R6Q57_000746 [Mikania cordata]